MGSSAQEHRYSWDVSEKQKQNQFISLRENPSNILKE